MPGLHGWSGPQPRLATSAPASAALPVPGPVGLSVCVLPPSSLSQRSLQKRLWSISSSHLGMWSPWTLHPHERTSPVVGTSRTGEGSPRGGSRQSLHPAGLEGTRERSGLCPADREQAGCPGMAEGVLPQLVPLGSHAVQKSARKGRGLPRPTGGAGRSQWTLKDDGQGVPRLLPYPPSPGRAPCVPTRPGCPLSQRPQRLGIGRALRLKGGTRSESPARDTRWCPVPGPGFSELHAC